MKPKNKIIPSVKGADIKTVGKPSADFWRFVVSFLVVAIHISPFEKINGDLDFFFIAVLGRIAVPLFLMITGYYVIDKALENKRILFNYIGKIFKQYLFCVILYMPLNIYMGEFKEFEPSRILYILKKFFIDGTFYHLWYFPALILGILISFGFVKIIGIEKTLIVTALLYLTGLFGDSYYGIIKGNEIISGFYEGIFAVFDYTRNGLFYAPLFLCMGYFVKIGKQSDKYDLMYGFLMFLLMSAEGMILHCFGVQRHTSMYLFLTPLMFFVFRAIMSGNEGQNKRLRSMGTGIYIFHPMIIVGVRFAAELAGVKKVFAENNAVLYLTVCLASAAVAGIIYKITVLNSCKKTKKAAKPH